MVADVRGGYGQSYIMMNNKGWVYNLNISRQTLKPFDSPSNHANRMIKVYIFSFGIVYYQKLSNNTKENDISTDAGNVFSCIIV